MTIKETKNYSLIIGTPIDNAQGGKIYQVINKKYEVVEVETPMLPQALRYLNDLEAGLAAMEDMYAEDQSSKILPIYSGRNKVN